MACAGGRHIDLNLSNPVLPPPDVTGITRASTSIRRARPWVTLIGRWAGRARTSTHDGSTLVHRAQAVPSIDDLHQAMAGVSFGKGQGAPVPLPQPAVGQGPE